MNIRFGDLVRMPFQTQLSRQKASDEKFMTFVADRVANQLTDHRFGVFPTGNEKAQLLYADGDDFRNMAAEIVYRFNTQQQRDRQTLQEVGLRNFSLDGYRQVEAQVVGEFADRATVLDVQA